MSCPQYVLPEKGIAWIPPGFIVLYTGPKEVNTFSMIVWANKSHSDLFGQKAKAALVDPLVKFANKNGPKPYWDKVESALNTLA